MEWLLSHELAETTNGLVGLVTLRLVGSSRSSLGGPFLREMAPEDRRGSPVVEAPISSSMSLCCLCMCLMWWDFRLHFCGQNGHWNMGSFPHSHSVCLWRESFRTYVRPHLSHGNTPWFLLLLFFSPLPSENNRKTCKAKIYQQFLSANGEYVHFARCYRLDKDQAL